MSSDRSRRNFLKFAPGAIALFSLARTALAQNPPQGNNPPTNRPPGSGGGGGYGGGGTPPGPAGHDGDYQPGRIGGSHAHDKVEVPRQPRKNLAADQKSMREDVQQLVRNTQELQKAIELSPGSTAFIANLAYAYAVSGMRDEALKLLNDLKNRSPQAFSNAPEIAMIYAGLEEKDQAMAWLEKAYAERFSPWVLMRPCYNPLRSDPRFQDLLHRLGLQS